MKTILTAFLTMGGLAWAQAPQAPNPTQQLPAQQLNENGAGPVPAYRITVVSRTTKAINYHLRGGSTKIGFQGTALMPAARGEAMIESKQGVIKIDADMEQIGPATAFGPEYLTYVMWAITPEGRATNVGEVLVHGGKSRLDATTELQSFGLIVTAEPYFAVTQPSDVVVMENFVRKDTTGTIEQVDAKFELLQRGQYVLNVKPSDIAPRKLNSKVPLDLYEARNAVQIARWTGAQQYADDTFMKATQDLENAEGYLKSKAGKKPIGTAAREAVQMAEDARIITVKKIGEERLAAERQAGADRESRAENGLAAAQSETDRVTREAADARVSAQVETDRVKRDNDAQTAAAQTEAGRLRRENDAQRATAQTELDRVGSEKKQLETEKLRAQLLLQFNTILQTRDADRGLIVNMPDALFDTGTYSLRPEGREKLAELAVIVAKHPGLRLEVEGHTDSVGNDADSQQLSEQRGGSVRDYLIQQGMGSSVSSRGFGSTEPVASNETASGREQNRRVELVVSGEIIGTVIGVPVAAR